MQADFHELLLTLSANANWCDENPITQYPLLTKVEHKT